MAPRTHILRELIADPGPLGLYAFATITFMAGAAKCGWVTDVSVGIYQVAFWYGGLAQVIAGVIDLFRGSAVTGSTFTAFGLHWMLQGMSSWPGNSVVDLYPIPTEYQKLQGFYFLSFTIIAIGATVGVARISYLHIILLCGVDVVFFLDAVNCFVMNMNLNKGIGYVAVLVAFLAFYLALAAQWEESSTIRLPIFRIQPPDETAECYEKGDAQRTPAGDSTLV